jgi:hypothetical protein
VVADIEKFDRVPVIPVELQKRMGARGDHPAAELERLRDRAGRVWTMTATGLNRCERLAPVPPVLTGILQAYLLSAAMVPVGHP